MAPLIDDMGMYHINKNTIKLPQICLSFYALTPLGFKAYSNFHTKIFLDIHLRFELFI